MDIISNDEDDAEKLITENQYSKLSYLKQDI